MDLMVYVAFAAFLSILITSVFIFRAYIGTRIRAMAFLFAFYITLLGWSLMDMLYAITGNIIFDRLDDIFGPLSMLNGLLFSLELYRHVLWIDILGGILTGTMIGLVAMIMVVDSSYVEEGYKLFMYPELVLFLLLSVVTFFVAYKMFIKANQMGVTKTVPILFTSAAVTGYLGGLISIYVDWVFGISYSYNIFAATGSVLFALLLIRYPYSAFILPVYAERLLVFSRGGIPLYSREIVKGKVKYDDAFTSSAISGVISLLTELLESREIDLITMEGKDIHIATGQEVVGIMIVENYNPQIQSALEAFVHKFEEKFAEIIKKNVSDMKVYKKGGDTLFATVFATLVPT